MEILSNSEKLKTDYDKRIKSVQKEIDRCDEYKDKVHDLELKLKSNFKNISYQEPFSSVFTFKYH
jgi:vacuolar-type H+-ATPase subunit C/Vma6